MISKIPIVACPIEIKDIFYPISKPKEKLKDILTKMLNLKFVFFTNSATSSFYFILEALKKIKKDRNEVILPAYTASSLVLAVKKANLKVILCDINLEDFNLDTNYLKNIVSKSTLAIVGVHMFGIVERALLTFKKYYPDIFIIEDCAQAFGSYINDFLVGSLADVSFFSFNRGKNIPAYGGGCILTNNNLIAENIEDIIEDIILENKKEFILLLKIIGLSLAMRPFFYGLFFPLLSKFKNTKQSSDFYISDISNIQAKVIIKLLEKLSYLSKIRYKNAMFLYENLSSYDKIKLPKIPDNTMPAFNRLPILVRDMNLIEVLEKKLFYYGIETSRMYKMPLHQHFDLGYKKKDFLNANYFARHLLTLPVHPFVSKNNLLKMIEIIKGL